MSERSVSNTTAAQQYTVERNAASAPFFDAARSGTLLIRVCQTCDHFYAPHVRRCRDGSELEWRAARGTATLVTWAVDHSPAISTELSSSNGGPPVIGIVELSEGPWMYTALPGVRAASLSDGMDMHLEFLTLGTGEPVPVFAPTVEHPESEQPR
ncbi:MULTISPECIES: Zn-ribbon domain-containing OB-fold protein [unclassified Rhodococcus (in: high G+C Gram-positive bacteria)]|uniref:Zn-ribbon domain-containing OB-fold protein n=1 Tax=unclassified Rhodococcus (in: high G+C Gram-positive bacteria) TaxID=192944 RepID=UPI0006F36032|nr:MULTISPECIES: OB-fold domain-containing protein [unclassified Rhodococcus (in: high G+C Gram-positive bacteria)]KQU38384.1 hypothetical protein ASG69_14765 [Rhodococcus sp. Leaf225]KQU39747.1 hypothetical protein ASH03_19770 [Rhodococcus sp. Leaf258]